MSQYETSGSPELDDGWHLMLTARIRYENTGESGATKNVLAPLM